MLFANKHQIFTFVTTEKTGENFSSSTALYLIITCGIINLIFASLIVYLKLHFYLHRFFAKTCQLVEQSATCADSPCRNGGMCQDIPRTVAVTLKNTVVAMSVSIFLTFFQLKKKIKLNHLG